MCCRFSCFLVWFKCFVHVFAGAVYKCVHTHTHAHARTHAHTHAHTHSRTHITHTHTHTHTRARAHTRIHLHSRTHTHTHIQTGGGYTTPILCQFTNLSFLFPCAVCTRVGLSLGVTRWTRCALNVDTACWWPWAHIEVGHCAVHRRETVVGAVLLVRCGLVSMGAGVELSVLLTLHVTWGKTYVIKKSWSRIDR